MIQGLIPLPPVGRRLYEVHDDELPPEFARAWPQIALRLSEGGHGLRPWAEHIDAAFVGQWALTMQSSWNSAHNCSFFPVLEAAVEQAHNVCDTGVSAADTLPLASDLAAAWTAVVSTSQRAVALDRVEKRLPPETRLGMGQWLTDTDQRMENLREMPDKAQRACSHTYLGDTPWQSPSRPRNRSGGQSSSRCKGSCRHAGSAPSRGT